MAPAAKSGSGHEVDLVGRIGDAVVVLEPLQRERPDLEAEAGQVVLAGDVHHSHRDVTDTRVAAWPRADRR